MLKKNLLANYLGQGWSALMGFIFIPGYIQYIGIEGYGLIGVFAVMQVSLGLLDMGMAVTLNRELARFTAGVNTQQFIRNLLRSMEIVAIGIGVLIGIIINSGSNWIARNWLTADSLSYDVISSSISIMGLVVALRIIEGLYRSVLVGMQHQALYNVIISIMATLRWGGSLAALVFVKPTLETFFHWQLASSIITLGILMFSAYRILPQSFQPAHFSMKALSLINRFAGGFVGFTLINIIISQADKVLLMHLLDLSKYGYYMLAASVAGALNVLTGPVVQAYYPRLSELHAKGLDNDFSKCYHQAAQLITIFYGTAVIVFAMMGEFILGLWTHNIELAVSVAPMLTVLALGNFINGLMWIPVQAQLSIGWTRLMITANLIALAIFIPLLMIVVPRFGPIGAAWVWLFVNSIYALIMTHFMHQKILISEKWRWYFEDVALPLIASFSLVFFASKLFNFEHSTTLVDFAKLGLVSMLALIAAILAAKQVRASLFLILRRYKWRNYL